jgi:hypothetical protein
MPRAWAMALLCAGLATPGAAAGQPRSTITSWSFGPDLSAMSALSPATQEAVVAQCRMLTEQKAQASGVTSPDVLRELQEDCVRGFTQESRAR